MRSAEREIAPARGTFRLTCEDYVEAIVQSGRPTGDITRSRVSEALTMMAAASKPCSSIAVAKQESHAV